MSFDPIFLEATCGDLVSQSLWNRAMSFDTQWNEEEQASMSQSLWNRAMSFD